MTLKEITAITFQFHRAIYISLTEKCPIRCRHCFIESEPTRTEKADLQAFEKWIDGIVAADKTHVFFFSGGEPLSHPKALRYGLDACFNADRYAVLCTSGFWARSLDSATKLLNSYPRFGCLWLSTDIFHEEFVPLTYLRHAVEAAIELNIDVVFQIVDNDPDNSEFMKRFSQDVGFDLIGPEQIYITPLGMTGRAAKELSMPLVQIAKVKKTLDHIPDAPCSILGTPWMREDGILCACPNLKVFREPSHPLHLGDLNKNDFDAISNRADSDGYVQALRIIGPRGIAENFPVKQWGWNPDTFNGTSICDLCHSLAAVPNLPEKIREATIIEGYKPRFDAMRMLLYSETDHLSNLGDSL